MAGLVATVITRWGPNERFTFGYVLSGDLVVAWYGLARGPPHGVPYALLPSVLVTLPNGAFSILHSYVRAEVIAGFVNSLFLLFVAFFIFAEAVEVRTLLIQTVHLSTLLCCLPPNSFSLLPPSLPPCPPLPPFSPLFLLAPPLFLLAPLSPSLSLFPLSPSPSPFRGPLSRQR